MWLEIQMPSISPRAGHVAICKLYKFEDSGMNDSVLIFGGGNNEDVFFNDLYSIKIPFKAGQEEATGDDSAKLELDGCTDRPAGEPSLKTVIKFDRKAHEWVGTGEHE